MVTEQFRLTARVPVTALGVADGVMPGDRVADVVGVGDGCG